MKKPLNSADEKKTGDITKAEIEAIKSGLHSNPFALLGVHETPEGWTRMAFLKARSIFRNASRCVTAHAATMPNGL